jgi:Terminase RNaseH-like domain
VQKLAERWKPRRVLVEDAGTGTSLVQELRGKVSGIIAVKPEGDKRNRMAVASAQFEAGEVLLPERAPWLPDLEAELFLFPGGRHDDQLLYKKKTPLMASVTDEEMKVILEKSRIPRIFFDGPSSRLLLSPNSLPRNRK